MNNQHQFRSINQYLLISKITERRQSIETLGEKLIYR